MRRHRPEHTDGERGDSGRGAAGEGGLSSDGLKYRATPDGRYFVVRGRLWRASNPALTPEARERLVHALMSARQAVRTALRTGEGLAQARSRVNDAKVALGERGPVWWSDGAPDVNRHMARNTAYAAWFAEIDAAAAPGDGGEV